MKGREEKYEKGEVPAVVVFAQKFCQTCLSLRAQKWHMGISPTSPKKC